MSLTRAQIAEQLRDIGLQGELGKPFKSLSGGQQQRLALFIAVFHKPALLQLE